MKARPLTSSDRQQMKLQFRAKEETGQSAETKTSRDPLSEKEVFLSLITNKLHKEPHTPEDRFSSQLLFTR